MTVYTIHYGSIENFTSHSKTEAERYLEKEEGEWSKFLNEISSLNQFFPLQSQRGALPANFFVDVFGILKEKVNDPAEFNNVTQMSYRTQSAAPPPSTSIEGQLILGLYEHGRIEEAASAYLSFISKSISLQLSSNMLNHSRNIKGWDLLQSAYVCEALPFNTVSAQKIAGINRTAENKFQAIDDELRVARNHNSNHEKELSAFRDHAFNSATRLQALICARERRREAKFKEWLESQNSKVDQRFQEEETRLDAIDRVHKSKQENRQTEHDKLVELFHTQLRLRAPVKLWERREETHRKNSRNAFRFFLLMTIATVITGLSVPYFAGDYLASSFFSEVCTGEQKGDCERFFSAKGPLTLGGLIVTMSLLLWQIRLQYLVFLSERHLSLDAGERKAFAETFLAMKEKSDVGLENEAIILSSLFRPTQDGIIKDDEASLDLSMAALIAKQLSRT